MHTSKSTVCRHLEKLGKFYKLEVWVPCNFSGRIKEDRMAVDTSLLSRVKQDSFLDKILIGNEKWIPYNNIIRKRHWLDNDQASILYPKANINADKFYCVYGRIDLI